MTWVGWSIWHFRVFAEGIISGQFDYFLFSFATNLFGEPNSRWDFQSVGDQQRACCVTYKALKGIQSFKTGKSAVHLSIFPVRTPNATRQFLPSTPMSPSAGTLEY